MEDFKPGYLKLYQSRELFRRIEILNKKLSSCQLCPRRCKVNRLKDEKGICKTGKLAYISSFGPHFGEESPLVGTSGSGTIFFTHCNLGCIFCQNYDISHLGQGYSIEDEGLADTMLKLKKIGCHNINFVTPSHVVSQILRALPLAIEKGLDLPLVYNTGGYDLVSTLELLEGVFDIYMPDYKFAEAKTAERYCNAPDYPEIVKSALKEMHKQTGDLIVDKNGIAQRGLIIRHLVLPENLAGTEEVMRFIASELSQNSYVNLMDQYRPAYHANDLEQLNRKITPEEYAKAVELAKKYGLKRLDGWI
ncbi:MAG: radical SAM protein [candidate division Zixibacteria bacterium]|nr:radical SAM protein [candidate division Zixibacteria bacterium]